MLLSESLEFLESGTDSAFITIRHGSVTKTSFPKKDSHRNSEIGIRMTG